MIGPVRSRATFQRFRTEALRARHGWLRLSYLPSDDGGGIAVAFALDRRSGNAVRRNRIRRQIRHVLADLAAGDDPRLAPGDYLVTVRGPLHQRSNDEIVRHVSRALTDLGSVR